jgi:hypothetical protein
LANIGYAAWLTLEKPRIGVTLFPGVGIQLLAWFFLCLVSFRIFQLENPFDEEMFWRTRPIRGIVLFIEKMIFSTVLFSLMMVQALVIHLTIPKYEALSVTTFASYYFFLIIFGYWSMALVISLFISRGKSRTDMSYLGTLFLAGLVVPILLKLFPNVSFPPIKGYELTLRHVVVVFCAIGSWGAMLHQYWTGFIRRSWFILIITWLWLICFCMWVYICVEK